MAAKKILKCVHGLIWQTCSTCSQKTEKDVQKELDFIKAQQMKNLEYDYQDPAELSDLEQDTDYDLDDMRMGG